MSGNLIGFGEEVKKLCQQMCSVRMLIWSAAYYSGRRQPTSTVFNMQQGI